MCLTATGRPSRMRTPAYTVPKPPFPSILPTLYVLSKVSVSISLIAGVVVEGEVAVAAEAVDTSVDGPADAIGTKRTK